MRRRDEDNPAHERQRLEDQRSLPCPFACQTVLKLSIHLEFFRRHPEEDVPKASLRIDDAQLGEETALALSKAGPQPKCFYEKTK